MEISTWARKIKFKVHFQSASRVIVIHRSLDMQMRHKQEPIQAAIPFQVELNKITMATESVSYTHTFKQ